MGGLVYLRDTAIRLAERLDIVGEWLQEQATGPSGDPALQPAACSVNKAARALPGVLPVSRVRATCAGLHILGNAACP